MERDSRPPVLVLGAGVTALGVLRSLWRAEIPCLSLGTPPGGFVRRSRWFRAAPDVAGIDPARDLAGYLQRCGLDSAVLLPCSDAWTLAVAELDAATAERFPSSVAPTATLQTLVDKGDFAALLRRLDLPHPRTEIVHGEGDIAGLPDAVLEGAFLKPRDSQRFFARFGTKAFRIRGRSDAASSVRAATGEGLSMVLQEYIPGPADHHYFVDGFMDAGGHVRAWFVRRRLRMYPSDFGNSTLMVSVAPEEAAPAIESLGRLLAATSYRGIFSAEFKLDPRDGQFKLLEVNARAWWYVEFADRCGANVCSLAYHDALGLSMPSRRKPEVGRRCVYPYYDLHACLELRARRRLPLLTWARSWLGAAQPVFDWRDPLPALDAVSRLLRDRIRRSTRGKRRLVVEPSVQP
jgi:predicted ATP-grasp superfamily ATP-dependent carboligase